MTSPRSARLQDFLRAFEEHFAFVRRTLRRQGVPAADLDDLAQEVFIVMWRRWSEFDPARGLRPWLAGIAYNVVGSHHLRRPRREVPVQDLDATDGAPTGEEELAATRARRFLIDVLDRLPDTYRTVLVMRDIDGVPMRQIAALQGVPLFTAYTRLRKARKDLAAAIRAHRDPPVRRPALLAGWRWLLPAAATALLGLGLMAIRGQTSTGMAMPGARGDLLAYWRLDERSGAHVRDLSGRGSDCVIRGAEPAWGPGRHDGALALRGRSWLECPPAASAGEAITVSLWVKVDSLPAVGNRALVTVPTHSGARDDFFLGFVRQQLTFNSDRLGIHVVHRAPLAEGWHHLAVTRTAHEARLFLDGRPVGRTRRKAPLPGPADAPLLIGAGNHRSGAVYERLDGTVDEVALFNRTLAADEIAALAAGAAI